MKFYKNGLAVFAFDDDGSQDHLITSEFTQMTDDEILSHLNPPAQIPTSITALQGLLAIDQAGLSASYDAWANDPVRTFAQRAFLNKAHTWKRDDATLNAAASAMGLTSGQVDSMFAMAAAL
jgi:hypothetical protein